MLSLFYCIWSENDLFHIKDTEAQKSMVVSEAQLEWFLQAMTESARGSKDRFFQKSEKLDCGGRKLLKFWRSSTVSGEKHVKQSRSLALVLLVHVLSIQQSRSSSSIQLSKRKGVSYGLLGCARSFGTFRVSVTRGCSKGERGFSEAWSLIRYHASLWALISNNFCNYSIDNILLSWSPFL